MSEVRKLFADESSPGLTVLDPLIYADLMLVNTSSDYDPSPEAIKQARHVVKWAASNVLKIAARGLSDRGQNVFQQADEVLKLVQRSQNDQRGLWSCIQSVEMMSRQWGRVRESRFVGVARLRDRAADAVLALAETVLGGQCFKSGHKLDDETFCRLTNEVNDLRSDLLRLLDAFECHSVETSSSSVFRELAEKFPEYRKISTPPREAEYLDADHEDKPGSFVGDVLDLEASSDPHAKLLELSEDSER